MRRTLTWLLLSPIWLLVSGCVENVWLPDSSGFVYITLDHCLMHYDLATKKETVIVKHDWLHSEEEVLDRPAVSPDSKRVALVRHVSSKDKETVQVLIYDLVGKQVVASKDLPLPGNSKFSPKPLVRSGMAFWSPDGKRILFQVRAPLFKNGERVPYTIFSEQEARDVATLGFYDLATQKHTVVKGLAIDEEDTVMGFSPCTPDGRGFLAARTPEAGKKPDEGARASGGWSEFKFVDWTGRQSTFTITAAAKQAEAQEKKDAEARKQNTERVWAGEMSPYWEKNVAFVPSDRGHFVVDPVNRVVDYQPKEMYRLLNDYAKKNEVDVTLWKEGVLLQFRDIPKEGAAPKPDDPPGKRPEKDVDVELVLGADLKAGTPGKVVKVARISDIETWVISPNGRYVLLCCAQDSEEGEKCRRMVINLKGEKVADLTEKVAYKEPARRAVPPPPPVKPGPDPAEAPPPPAPLPPPPKKT